MKIQHCLTLLFVFCFFGVGEFQIPESSSPGPVLRSAKVRFRYSHPRAAPEASSLQQNISVRPERGPSDPLVREALVCPVQLEAGRRRDVVCCSWL